MEMACALNVVSLQHYSSNFLSLITHMVCVCERVRSQIDNENDCCSHFRDMLMYMYILERKKEGNGIKKQNTGMYNKIRELPGQVSTYTCLHAYIYNTC